MTEISRSKSDLGERRSETYPWLTIVGRTGYYADTLGCSPAESDRRVVIMQELAAGRLTLDKETR